MDKIENIKAPLPFPKFPIAYEDSLTVPEAIGKLQHQINQCVEGINELIESYGEFEIVQTAGQSTSAVMSQKATTDGINALDTKANATFLAKNDIVDVTGTARDKVLSQYATTLQLNNKISNERVAGITGDSEIDIMSQKATTDALNSKVDNDKVVGTTGDSETAIMSQKATTDALNSKVDNDKVVGTTGDSETAIMSQKATTDALNDAVNGDLILIRYKGTTSPYDCTKTFAEVKQIAYNVTTKAYLSSIYETGVMTPLVITNVDDNEITFKTLAIVENSVTAAQTISNVTRKTFILKSDETITLQTDTISIDDQATLKNSKTAAPSNRYVHATFVEYNDIEDDELTSDNYKIPSSKYILDNYTKKLWSSLDNSAVTYNSNNYTFGFSLPTNARSVTFQVNTNYSGSPGTTISFIVGSVQKTDTTLKLNGGRSLITLTRYKQNNTPGLLVSITSTSADYQEQIVEFGNLSVAAPFDKYNMVLNNFPSGFSLSVENAWGE